MKMVILFRFALIALIVFLIMRSFVKAGVEKELNRREKEKGRSNFKSGDKKKISKDVGEYVDYEEVD